MVAVLRTHGLVLFILAVAVVSLFQGLIQARPAALATGAILIAIAIEEAQKRAMIPRAVWFEALRWSCVIGALGYLLQ
ncbi:MAG: hypothetical protein ACE15B_13230 [Bryobacteraceae bacterium]